jgi:hypothetical protein
MLSTVRLIDAVTATAVTDGNDAANIVRVLSVVLNISLIMDAAVLLWFVTSLYWGDDNLKVLDIFISRNKNECCIDVIASRSTSYRYRYYCRTGTEENH